MEYTQGGEAVSIASGYEGGEDLVDEFSFGREFVGSELRGTVHLFRMGSGQGGGQGGVKAVGASASASCPTAGSGGSKVGEVG